MGEIRQGSPTVSLVFAAFSCEEALLDQFPAMLTDQFGIVGLASHRYEFVETNYYARTMGPRLLKQLFVCRELQPADCLPNIKVQANEIEAALARLGKFDVERPLNLDPGTLDSAKFILASTKDHAHRIYLGRGIFAELTLQYRDKQWQPLPWTYPDYQRDDVRRFLIQARDYHREQLKRQPSALGRPHY